MARARYRGTFDTLAFGNPQYFQVVANAIVTACEGGTSTPIAATIYAARSGGTTLTNPMTAESDGSLEFFLETPQDVTLVVDGSGSGLGTITVDWEPVLPSATDMVTLSRVGTFTALQTFGTGGWPADYDSPSSYEPVKSPVSAAFVDGTTASPSTTVAPAVSFSRIAAGDWIGEGAGNTYLIGQFNLTAERGGNGGLDPLDTKINHDVLVVRALQTTPANMQAVAGVVVQDAVRGTAPFDTDDATTKANAQKNLSGFAAFFLADAWNPLFETIGGEVNVLSDYGTTDASSDYYKADGTQIGQAPWVDSLGATQPYQPGRHIGWSIIGKGWAGHTAGLIIGADPYATSGGNTATANAGRWATAIDIQPDSIWSSTKRALRVPNNRKIVSRKAASGEEPLLYLGTTDATVLNTPTGSPGYLYVNDATEAARWQSTGLRLPNANKLFSVTTGAAETPLLYMNASNNTILNAASGQSHQFYAADTTLLAAINATGLAVGNLAPGTLIDAQKDQASDTTLRLTNAQANSAARAVIQLVGQGASGGDLALHFKNAAVSDWTIGLDNSVAGDPLVFANSAALGTTNALQLSPTSAQFAGAICPSGQTAAKISAYFNASLATNTKATIGASTFGILFAQDGTSGEQAIVFLNGGLNTVTAQGTPGAGFTFTNSGTAFAIYHDGTDYVVHNKNASSRNLQYFLLSN